jgi:SAM-dependent methyltransferase
VQPVVRVCPLLERESCSVPLADAPPPWSLRQCSTTGFVYLANPPAQDSFREELAWEVTYAREAERRRMSEPFLYGLSSACKAFRHRFLRRNKMVCLVRSLVLKAGRRDVSSTIRLVDIGCAQGSLPLKVAARLPKSLASRVEPIGLEISTHLAAYADAELRSHGGRCIHGTGIEGLATLEPGSVDVIVMSCILEHEIEPLPLLRRCRERLVTGGGIVVKVPNYASIARRLRGPRWCGYRWPDHVNYFTPQTLSAMAAAAGLRVVRMNFFDRTPTSDSLYAILGCDGRRALTSPHASYCRAPLRRAA